MDTYIISPLFWTVSEEKQTYDKYDELRFHVKSGDYFITLATIIGFFEETLRLHSQEKRDIDPTTIEAARAVQDELKYLQQHFEIKER